MLDKIGGDRADAPPDRSANIGPVAEQPEKQRGFMPVLFDAAGPGLRQFAAAGGDDRGISPVPGDALGLLRRTHSPGEEVSVSPTGMRDPGRLDLFRRSGTAGPPPVRADPGSEGKPVASAKPGPAPVLRRKPADFRAMPALQLEAGWGPMLVLASP